jgi:hypothetical protein
MSNPACRQAGDQYDSTQKNSCCTIYANKSTYRSTSSLRTTGWPERGVKQTGFRLVLSIPVVTWMQIASVVSLPRKDGVEKSGAMPG